MHFSRVPLAVCEKCLIADHGYSEETDDQFLAVLLDGGWTYAKQELWCPQCTKNDAEYNKYLADVASRLGQP